MPSRPADRALRRLVADLASLAPDDVEAILGELEPGQRARTQALLAHYIGASPTLAAPSVDDDAHRLAATPGLSPWLAARLLPPGADPGGPAKVGGASLAATSARGAMTPRARDALRAAVAGLTLDDPPPTARSPGRPALFTRLRRAIGEGGPRP
jgi:hypothetical protein